MNPPTTTRVTTTNEDSSLADPLPGSQFTRATQFDPAADHVVVAGNLLATDQHSLGAQLLNVGGEPSPAAAIELATPSMEPPLPDTLSTTIRSTATAPHSSSSPPPVDHLLGVAQTDTVGGFSEPPVPPIRHAPPIPRSADGWLELRIWAEMLHDAQQARIAGSNRAERGGVDSALYEPHIRQLEAVEHACALAMRRCFRRVVPAELVAWQKLERGIGEHLVARLLGHLGDPYVATPHEWTTTPPEDHECDPVRCGSSRHLVALPPYVRTVSQLWSYCGHGDPTRKKTKGMSADDAFGLGSPVCKTLVHLLAEACMKQPPGNTYRTVYEHRREITTERVHATPCVRCGPSGKPAAEGSPWSKAHQHADALRVVGKEMLRDMWRIRHASSQVGPDIHALRATGESLDIDGHPRSDFQNEPAVDVEPLEEAS